jgi:osmoprotectant transport system substrate-binding protein
MTTRTRTIRAAALALAIVAVLAACGSEGSSGGTSSGGGGSNGTTPSGSTPGSTPAGDTLAGTFVLGGPPECPERPFCQVGLEKTYGLVFKDFTALDAGGPLTVAALEKGDIQVGLLFTTDGNIPAKGFVLLEDDKSLQPSDNVTPVFNKAIADEYGDDLQTLVDGVSEKITTEDLTALNQKVTIDQEDAADVASAWVEENVPAPSSATPKTGTTIIVGSANFDESAILAEIYAKALKDAGYPVETKLKIGSREVYFPALERGEVGMIPEYAGTLLAFLDESTPASTDPDETYASLTKALQDRTVVAFASAPAEDKNGFVVTKDTADTYDLTKISDLAQPAP